MYFNFNTLNLVSLIFIISSTCIVNVQPISSLQCPTRIVKASLKPPRRIYSPQPPYGCSQVNYMPLRDKAICFTNPQLAELRRRRRNNILNPNPDIGVPIEQLIKNHGYPVESHYVTTNDGYILTLIRIPYGKKTNSSSTKGPVLLQHGILSNAVQWILNVPEEKSLGFLLADSGYDVWLANGRGTRYSQGHETLNADVDESYWNFGWHEMAKYDVPSTIDFILTNYTDTSLFYIGHSMGSTVLYTALSLDPSYNDKIKMAYLMAPIAYLGNSTNVVHWSVLSNYYLQPFYEGLTKGQFFSTAFINNYLKRYYPMCESSAAMCSFCIHGFFSFFGFDYEQMDFERLPVILSYFPDTTSTKSLIHYAQIMATGQFHQFDYGSTQNMKYYNGSCSPPLYNLKNVKVKIMTFWSWNDNFSTRNDVWKTNAEMSNVVEDVEIPHCAFNHLDFAIAKDADKYIYKKIIKSMDRFKSS